MSGLKEHSGSEFKVSIFQNWFSIFDEIFGEIYVGGGQRYHQPLDREEDSWYYIFCQKAKKREQLKFICTPLLFSWRVNRTIFPFLLSFIVIVASSVFQYTLTRGIGPKDLETFLLSKARLVQNHNFQLMSRTC